MANFIQGSIKHPGAVKNAAKRHGVTTRQEAERESRSKNPHIRARGILAKRFEKGGDLHRNKKVAPLSDLK